MIKRVCCIALYLLSIERPKETTVVLQFVQGFFESDVTKYSQTNNLNCLQQKFAFWNSFALRLALTTNFITLTALALVCALALGHFTTIDSFGQGPVD